jgi:hypothetical protein
MRLNPFLAALNLIRTLLPLKNETRLRVEGMIRARDVSSLASIGNIQDQVYGPELESVLAERQIAALFKKNEQFSDDDRCTAAAHKTFERGERICRITNRRLDYFYEHLDRLPPKLAGWLNRMERDIASLLGERADFDGAMPSLIRVTNGATEDRPRRRSIPFLKVTGQLRAPRAAISALGRLLLHYGVDLASCRFTGVERNVITLVPKSWKTHRTIAKEPTHSLPFQLALDTWFKSKLRKWRIDLSSQAKNQEFARIGSIDGSMATIDLEMASDTLAYNAVAWMFPSDWFELLCSFRSSSYSAPWGHGNYAKFSSMGNGYTFTLETLIFSAACKAVGSQRFAVYGDDIALETHLVPDVVELLSFLGFKVNDAKSFFNPDSRFRESCGCDYYMGHLVTPFYLRECPRESDYAGMSHSLNGLIGSAMVPGPLWDWAAAEVRRLGLRLVPWNDDSRSGVWITPRKAWETGKLEISRRRSGTPSAAKVMGASAPVAKPQLVSNPNLGFPVFKGYVPKQDCRKTTGWRSLFLWFIEKNYGGDRPDPMVANRTAVFLKQLTGMSPSDLDNSTATVKSSVITRTRYVHGTCRFSPKTATTPSHLFLWDEVVGTKARG